MEDSSWVRVRDKYIFSRRVTGRPSDEGARSVRNMQGKTPYFARGDLKNSVFFNKRLLPLYTIFFFYLKWMLKWIDVNKATESSS